MLSPYILAIVLAWTVSQGSKFLISSVKQWGTVNIRRLYASGEMPSAHTAAVVALMTIIGLKDGINGAGFAVAALLAAIVMYDAIMVRRSTGEQGLAIQELIREQKSKVLLPRAAKGHKPLEVAAGALIGLGVGLLAFFITR